MKITIQTKMTIEEMRQYYTQEFPYFEANNQRVGRFAKKLGYKIVRQMVNRKYERFYLKDAAIQAEACNEAV